MDGLWTIEFGSNAGSFGSGVVVMRDGKIAGGDASYYYVGTYESATPTDFSAVIAVRPFLPGAESVFKTFDKEFTLTLVGTLKDPDHAVALGRPAEMPGLDLGVRLTRRSETA